MARAMGRKSNKMGDIPQKAYEHFKKITPRDTGNARRRTRQQGNDIVANYPYAGRLNEGHSKQAPDGMVDPTIDYIRKLMQDIEGK